jgi:hypothetical protein
MTSTPTAAPTRVAVRVPDDAELGRLAAAFRAASPFPHVVVDGLLPPEVDLAAAFPDEGWSGWERYEGVHQAGKRICSDPDVIPAPLREVIEALNSPRALRMIERITGIEKLIPDPHLNGGGLHASDPGGTLTPHTDFHIYQRLDLYRQVNLLLYLNHDWSADMGGALELFADRGAEHAAASIVPTYGTCVIFRTDDRSVHGFTEPVRRERRSIALYYYTARESGSFGGGTTTYWRQRRGEAGRARQAVYQGALFASRAFSWVAHRAHPQR